MGAKEKRYTVIAVWVEVLAIVAAIIWHNYNSLPKLGLEVNELLGVVAITTFLLGFASVRLQSKLEDSRSAVARQVDRVLEQNANENLLPFPTSFSRYKVAEDFKHWDIITGSTVALTVSIFLATSSGKVSGDDRFQLLVLQLVHLVIVIIGSIGPYLAKKQFKKYIEAQPFHLYEDLEKSLIGLLKKEHYPKARAAYKKMLDDGDINQEKYDALIADLIDPAFFDHEQLRKQVLDAADSLARSIPEWCWLDLVRGSLNDPSYRKENKSHFQRLHKLASKTKEDDDYSMIAFVWSAYLLGPEDDYHMLVKNSDLEQIMGFSKEKKEIRKSPDAYAEMVLREAIDFKRTLGESASPADAEKDDSANPADAEKDDSAKKAVEDHQKEVWNKYSEVRSSLNETAGQ